MKTEQELKLQITPEFIKKLCEFAEGFGYVDYVLSQSSDLEQVRFNNIIFPLLIHRAVEAIWKTRKDITLFIHSDGVYFSKDGMDLKFQFGIYQPEILTACECAMLDCLIEVLK